MSGEELILNELEYQTTILETDSLYLETIANNTTAIRDMCFWIAIPFVCYLFLNLFK